MSAEKKDKWEESKNKMDQAKKSLFSALDKLRNALDEKQQKAGESVIAITKIVDDIATDQELFEQYNILQQKLSKIKEAIKKSSDASERKKLTEEGTRIIEEKNNIMAALKLRQNKCEEDRANSLAKDLRKSLEDLED